MVHVIGAGRVKTIDLLELYRAKAMEAEQNAAVTQDAELRNRLFRIAEGFRSLLAHCENALQEISAKPSAS